MAEPMLVTLENAIKTLVGNTTESGELEAVVRRADLEAVEAALARVVNTFADAKNSPQTRRY